MQIVGSESALFDGRLSSTKTKYKNEGVPASELTPWLMAWWRGTWKPAEKPAALAAMLAKIERLYGTKQWERLELALRLVDEPPRKERRRAAG